MPDVQSAMTFVLTFAVGVIVQTFYAWYALVFFELDRFAHQFVLQEDMDSGESHLLQVYVYSHSRCKYRRLMTG